jgi:acyl-CoA dehydrogenase
VKLDVHEGIVTLFRLLFAIMAEAGAGVNRRSGRGRRRVESVMSSWVARRLQATRLVPRLSATEREALEAGTVWVEGELFSGKPDFARVLHEPYPQLTAEEHAFLEGPVEEACRRVDDWTVFRSRRLPDDVFSFLKAEGFFGLSIPKAYGGLGFSQLASSAVFAKLASRCLPLSTLVLIPNSVGPAELLLAYGTPEQKDHYLPRLARGEEIPCFALTEPEAGSDATALRSRGLVFRGGDGRLRLRLDFEKRYITLAPIATLIGLAVRLHDPEGLLGKGPDVGITCVLVPADAPGVDRSRRHDPMGIPFPNGPIVGRDVVVEADRIIGGPARAGRGWQMLVEALSSGRAISVPAQSAGGAKATARGIGAYAAVRQQFGSAIARFEGIAEPLARIAGRAYLMEAARVFTCGAVDGGHKPAVVSAIVKYQQTELLRKIVADAMDVMGGAALCLGPRNLIARGHLGAPIGITVEGANILTRTLIVHGQGAVRCHPFARREMQALAAGDLSGLGRALLGHAAFFVRNVARAAGLSLTRGWLAGSPVRGRTARYYRKLAWASACFAVLSDVALVGLGGRLKQRGALAGRLADALSWMYLCLCALRRFEAEGRRDDDLPLVQWSAEHSLAQVQTAFDGLLLNLDVPFLGPILRGPIGLWSRLNPLAREPSDRLGARLARLLTTPGSVRDRLTSGGYHSFRPDEAPGRLETAFHLVTQAAPVLDRIRDATRAGRLPKAAPDTLVEEALAAGLITADDARLVRDATVARSDAIQVDSFSLQEYFSQGQAESAELATVP